MTSARALLPAGLRPRIDAVRDEIVTVRRDLHAHPELGFHEERTTQVLHDRLTEAGLSPQVLPAGTGLICDVGAGDTCVALRADLDALPVTEAAESSYRSRNAGVMHACGHDVHAAALLGAG
ncbi:MAG TPA: M20/M25/M40 family metallo-hydrolase, partial [Kribbellaceae bacterium]